MTPGPPVPRLPTAEIRTAIEASDWPLASDLLGEHQRALTTVLADVTLCASSRQPWQDLLVAQRALLEELRVARDAVDTSLTRLDQDHRGARAWLRELA